jgi:hypothetical protein
MPHCDRHTYAETLFSPRSPRSPSPRCAPPSVRPSAAELFTAARALERNHRAAAKKRECAREPADFIMEGGPPIYPSRDVCSFSFRVGIDGIAFRDLSSSRTFSARALGSSRRRRRCMAGSDKCDAIALLPRRDKSS